MNIHATHNQNIISIKLEWRILEIRLQLEKSVEYSERPKERLKIFSNAVEQLEQRAIWEFDRKKNLDLRFHDVNIDERSNFY